MKKLGTLNVCGIVYEVLAGNSRDCHSLETAVGVCDCANRILWLHETLSPEALLDTLIHEALHAIITESGVLQVTKAYFKSQDTDDWEEAIIRVLSPHMLATFGPPQLEAAKGAKRGVRTK